MTPGELKSAIDALWNGNQSQAARELGLSSSRRMREFLAGDRSIPAGVADDITAMLAIFPNGKKNINPGTVVRSLQSILERSGMRPMLAAGAILGAAHANAQSHGCDVDDLIRSACGDFSGE